MMYIEHTPAEENLLNELKSVPTQATASVLLANVQEAAAAALRLLETPACVTHRQPENGKRVTLTNGKTNGYAKSVKQQQQIFKVPRSPVWERDIKAEQQIKSQTPVKLPPAIENGRSGVKHEEEEEEEEDEEAFTLLDVVDNYHVNNEKHRKLSFGQRLEELKARLSAETKSFEQNPKKVEEFVTLADVEDSEEEEATAHKERFDISRQSPRQYDLNSGPKSENKEFVYEIIRTSTTNAGEAEYDIVVSQKSVQQGPHNFAVNRRIGKGKRPVAASSPVFTAQQLKKPAKSIRVLNGEFASRPNLDFERADYSESDEESEEHFKDKLFSKIVAAATDVAAESIYRNSSSQMGINILSKLRELFTFDKSGSKQKESRKRRLDAQAAETIPQIKYRRVDNRFPKFIAPTSEDDDLDLLTAQYPTRANRLPSQPFQYFNGNNMSEEKPKLRKSMFAVPKMTRKLIKNTSYADVDFGDDDDDDDVEMLRGPRIAPTDSFKRPCNIPVSTQLNERCLKKPTELRSSILGTLSQDIVYPRKPTYAEMLRQNSQVVNNDKSYVMGTRTPNSIHSSGASTSLGLRQIGLKQVQSNAKILQRRTLLQTQKDIKDHEDYQQLLQHMIPNIYGNEKNKPRASQGRSQLQCSQRRSSSASAATNKEAQERKVTTAAPYKRQPLSSTINLIDDDDDVGVDDDDDVQFCGIIGSESTKLSYVSTAKKNGFQSPVHVIDNNEDDYVQMSKIVNLVDEPPKRNLSLKQTHSIHPPNNDEKHKLPIVERVNTLFERIHTSPHLNDNWIEELKSRYIAQKQSREQELDKCKQLTAQLAADRRAAEHDLQQRLKNFQIVDPDCVVVDEFPESEEDELKEPKLVEITAEYHARIKNALHGDSNEVLISKFNLNITRRDIQTLHGLNWLNDEVINFYMNLLTERSEIKHEKYGLPSVYAMNTFFVPRLLRTGYAGIKRWTRKVDIFTKDVIPVPVHVGGVHWCMAIIHLKNRTIKYYDSMGTPNPTVLLALEQYLKDESLDKRKQPFDTSQFVIESVADVPRQMNGSDCGVFSCMFAEYISRNCQINFTQQHMEYFRLKMILEIVQGELLQ